MHDPVGSPATATDREAIGAGRNPLGIEGVEYVEYATAKPQALGHLLEQMGFRPIARHRSREVLLYRQGEMNVVVNSAPKLPLVAAPAALEGPLRGPWGAAGPGSGPAPGAHGGAAPAPASTELSAIALRVRDAAAAHARVVDLGAWDSPIHVAPMELHIPAIHGAGASRIYFVDRHREFSIYDVDFIPVPGVDRRPPSIATLGWFGVVQYIGSGRALDWVAFYTTLFGMRLLPDDERFGILPKGRVLQSPDASFWLQLIEPDSGAHDGDERLQRVAFATDDVGDAVATLRARGIGFVETAGLAPNERGALTSAALGGVTFELVRRPAR